MQAAPLALVHLQAVSVAAGTDRKLSQQPDSTLPVLTPPLVVVIDTQSQSLLAKSSWNCDCCVNVSWI